MSFHREYENPYRLSLKLRLPCEHINYKISQSCFSREYKNKSNKIRVCHIKLKITLKMTLHFQTCTNLCLWAVN